MCIILSKDKTSTLPSEKILRTCFENNNDGAGFMYVNNNKVIIDKGYMTFDDFYKRYKKLCHKFNNFKNKSLVMHFRIGTSSGNTPANTHPYPITDNVSDLHKTYFECELGVVHNGIISDYNHRGDLSMNDTQQFIKNYVYKLYKYYPTFYKDEDIMLGVDSVCGGRLCFLDKNDELYYTGTFIEDNGIKYSNSSYLPYSYEKVEYNYANKNYNTFDSYNYDDFTIHGSYDDKNFKEANFLKKGLVVIAEDGYEYVIDYDNMYTLENGDLYVWEDSYVYGGYVKSLIDVNCKVEDYYY